MTESERNEDEIGVGRDGHVSALTLELLLQGELDEPMRELVLAHIESCDLCAQAHAEAVELRAKFTDGVFALPPGLGSMKPPAPEEIPRRATRSGASFWRGFGVAAVAAAAAAALFFLSPGGSPESGGLVGEVVRSGSAPEGVRIKGGSLDMEVFVFDGAAFERAESGGVVHPGQQLEFRVSTSKPGHLMLVGMDERGEVYLGYPQALGGQAAPIESMKEGVQLSQGLKLDGVLGRERIVGVFCEGVFSFESVRSKLEARVDEHRTSENLEALMPECAQRDIVLVKEAKE